MSSTEKQRGKWAATPAAPERLQLAAMGLESEFGLLVDDRPTRPEAVFEDPRSFIRGELMHRIGTSYHVPTGGAVYFDTGVIEVATPVIEIERGAPARAVRSLWESIRFVREELDDWERRAGRRARLTGFSAHYNVSFERSGGRPRARRSIERLALLLSYILPVPVLLLAANRRSTGVGVRPRGDRIEVTVDFTPSPALMVATATIIVGIVRAIMRWPSYDLHVLDRTDLPVLAAFAPVRHTTRHGWLARYSCFAANPFACDIDAPLWRTRDGRRLSLRTIAGLTARHFWREIRRISDPFTFRLIGSVLHGRAPSLLELPDRPPEYEDVGHLVSWDDLFTERQLSRSRYERVIVRAIQGRRLFLNGETLTPTGMRGWSQVVFRRERDAACIVLPIDFLVEHLPNWERTPR
ncbi:MAG: hypothetical protein IRZ00_00400 [Gemmatimonadetes bacterium]|nr:hypothetical protein [Gemmatimonadota bacterium]